MKKLYRTMLLVTTLFCMSMTSDKLLPKTSNNSIDMQAFPVTIYKDCEYRGESQRLSIGFHRLRDLGIGGRNISSFRIADGYKITLYEEDNFRGNSNSWYGSVSCLDEGRNNWNDKAMSVYISRDGSGNNGRNYNDYNDYNDYNNSRYPVTLYKDCEYRGESKALSAGFHRLNDLGIGGKNLSSFRLADGYKITLYEEDNFRGNSNSWYSSVPCLDFKVPNWNDKAMSIYISRGNNNYGNNRNRGNRENNYDNYSSNAYPVTLYQDCDYKGQSQRLSLGFHRLRDLGIGRNLSSFRIADGYKLTLYEEDNFRGKSDSWSGSVSCLGGNFWNDKAMSVYISRSM